MSYGWQGKRVRLVPLEHGKHFENCLRWVNDPEVSATVLVGDMPMSRIAEEEWFRAAEKGKETSAVFAIETLAGQHIGMSGIENIDWKSRVGGTGTMIGEKSEWGKGYGTDACRVRNRYAFDVLNLRMLLSGVLADNERSLRMLTRSGYVEYGRLAERYWKRGAYHDEIRLVITRDRWLGVERELQLSD